MAGGVALFSNDNRRPFLRTRWNASLDADWGLNAYLKTRSYRNTSPNRPEYYSPERLNEVSLGLSSRFVAAKLRYISIVGAQLRAILAGTKRGGSVARPPPLGLNGNRPSRASRPAA